MKEKTLADLKDLILTLKNKGQELREAHLFALWSAKFLLVKNTLMTLSVEEREWIDDQLKEWYEKEIEPDLNDAQKKLLEERFLLTLGNV